MDITLLSIFLVLGLFVAWVASYVIMVNKKAKSETKSSRVKDELFGKKRRSKKSNRGQFWSLE